MKQTVTQTQFTDIMTNHGFSYDGANALFEWLEAYEQATEEDLELDPIAFRCEYAEYETLKEILAQYEHIETLEELNAHTIVLDFGSGYIIQEF